MKSNYVVALAGICLLGILNNNTSITGENLYNKQSYSEKLYMRASSFGSSKLFNTANDEDSEPNEKYVELKRMNLAGYENWVPPQYKMQYSVENLGDILYQEDSLKQITNVESEKVRKNASKKV